MSDLSTGLSSPSSIDLLEGLSSDLCIMRGPELLEYIEGVQRLGPRFFKPALLIPNPSLLMHRETQKVRVVDRVRLGMFNVRLCLLELSFVEKQPYPGRNLSKAVLRPRGERRRLPGPPRNGESPSLSRPWLDIFDREPGGLRKPEIFRPSPGEGWLHMIRFPPQRQAVWLRTTTWRGRSKNLLYVPRDRVVRKI